jgi:hypothetical protein
VTQEKEGVFITSVDMKSIRVYTLETWRKNQEILSNFTEDVQAAHTIEFIANAWGAIRCDEQGRILIPADIRRKLGLKIRMLPDLPQRVRGITGKGVEETGASVEEAQQPCKIGKAGFVCQCMLHFP